MRYFSHLSRADTILGFQLRGSIEKQTRRFPSNAPPATHTYIITQKTSKKLHNIYGISTKYLGSPSNSRGGSRTAPTSGHNPQGLAFSIAINHQPSEGCYNAPLAGSCQSIAVHPWHNTLLPNHKNSANCYSYLMLFHLFQHV